MEVLLLVLIGVVLVFGFGVIVVSRLRSRRGIDIEPPAPIPPAPPETPSRVEVPPETQAEIEEALAPVELAEPEVIERPRFRDRLAKARATFTSAFTSVRSRGGIDAAAWDDLEAALLSADVGLDVTTELLGGLRERVKAKEITDPDALLEALKDEMKFRLEGADRTLHFEAGAEGSPNVWLFVGVNGVGKTTTIGKVGYDQTHGGRTVIMAAGDTFRAAGAEQLHTWAERAGTDFVRGTEGGDPSAVIFDAVQRAAARHYDLVLADTAGRLHTKTNLMEELRKVRRVAAREPGRVTEVLLVIDATTGQNGLAQAREFAEATDVTGVVLTKLDGSAKGGIVFAIDTGMGLPVKLVGLGEGVGDLVPFDPDDFVEALFA
ncbi:MAG TPA: signal recognition particle-docking protein FtsY [Acidimicrobiales bacterium]|nr:signal recognition particle-docking protein FtsY [Acidimicrobiales bacterium]